MDRIIVTGGYGFIGSSFVNLAAKKGYEVLVVDKLTYAADPKFVTEKHTFLEKDICDLTANDLGEYEYIVNFAAETHVDNSIDNPNPFLKTNIAGIYRLLELARVNSRLKKFIQISTDEVYGDMDDFWDDEANENYPLVPSSPYSATKASSDMLVTAWGRTFKIPYLITRTCNNYGVNQNKEKFLPKIYECIKEDKEIPVYGDGSQVREWIWVEDNVRAILDLLKNKNAFNTIINIGTAERYNNLEIIRMINEFLPGKKAKISFVEDRKGHDVKYAINSFRLKNYDIRYRFKKLPVYLKELYLSEN